MSECIDTQTPKKVTWNISLFFIFFSMPFQNTLIQPLDQRVKPIKNINMEGTRKGWNAKFF